MSIIRWYYTLHELSWREKVMLEDPISGYKHRLVGERKVFSLKKVNIEVMKAMLQRDIKAGRTARMIRTGISTKFFRLYCK